MQDAEQPLCRRHLLYGTHLVHASDEWYILAGRDFPPQDRYDGYLQLENGVGMMRLLISQVREMLPKTRSEAGKHEQSDQAPRPLQAARYDRNRVFLAAPTLRMLTDEITSCFPSCSAQVVAIRNDFFGERITVSGLITGRDLVSQLKGKDLGDCLLIPVNMLRSQEEVFLDDMTVRQVEESLQTKIIIVESDGRSLIEAVTGVGMPDSYSSR